MRFTFMSLQSIRLGFVAIAHPRDFVMSPKMYSLFPLPRWCDARALPPGCRAIVAAEAVLREPRKRKLTQEGIRTIAKTEERRGDIRRVACIDVSFT
jgi:hypothetical protein